MGNKINNFLLPKGMVVTIWLGDLVFFFSFWFVIQVVILLSCVLKEGVLLVSIVVVGFDDFCFFFFGYFCSFWDGVYIIFVYGDWLGALVCNDCKLNSSIAIEIDWIVILVVVAWNYCLLPFNILVLLVVGRVSHKSHAC